MDICSEEKVDECPLDWHCLDYDLFVYNQKDEVSVIWSSRVSAIQRFLKSMPLYCGSPLLRGVTACTTLNKLCKHLYANEYS